VNNRILVCYIASILAITGCSDEKTSNKDVGEELSLGASIVKSNCKVCHAQGINGAPVIGNKRMWEPRLGKGIPALIENASNGVGLMPAKGGNTALTHEEISLAVNFLVEQVK